MLFRSTTLYIGFRAPYVGSGNNKALICPLTNFESWFGNGSPSASPVFGAPIELNLNNHGIRSLGKNANNEFLIVAGSYAATGTFELYSWNGLAATAPVKLTADLTNLKPEGIVEVPASLSGTFTVDLVSDLGSDIPYNDDVENKDVTEPNHRRFLTSTIAASAGSSARMAVNSEESIEEILAASVKIVVYPNPFTDVINISFGNAKPAIAYIYSTTGRLVKELRIINTEDSYDLSELESGLYFVTYEGMEKAMRIVKK